MIKHLFIVLSGCFLSTSACLSQNSGMMPLTGLHYYNEGVWAKSFAFKIGGQQLYGNRVPLNQEIELVFEQPTGFTPDKKKIVYAGAEYSLTSEKGDVLLKNPNLLLLNEAKGFTAKTLKLLSLKFGIAEGLIQPNSKAVINIRLFDLKGKNQLRLEYPVSIAYPRETIWLTKAVQTLKSPPGSVFMVTDLKAKSLTVSVDSLLNPTKNIAYLKLEIAKIDGTDMVGMLQGKEKFWVYDKNYKEIPTTEILLKKVGGAMEGGSVNCTLNIPFRLRTDKTKGYFVRYRWESGDKTQVMDIVVAQ